MKYTALKMIIVFLLFFMGTGGILFLDNVCMETTCSGGNLILNMF